MATTLGIHTAEDLLHKAADGFRYELIKGEVRRMNPAGFRHGRITMNLSTPLDLYVKKEKLGVVCTAETGFLLASDPDHVRAPDVGFIRGDRLDEIGDTDAYWPGAPDLAVEVVSPHDSYGDVEEKVHDWLEAGSRMVLLVNPRKQTVTVYRSLADVRILKRGDVVEGADVIPGWVLPVSDIF